MQASVDALLDTIESRAGEANTADDAERVLDLLRQLYRVRRAGADIGIRGARMCFRLARAEFLSHAKRRHLYRAIAEVWSHDEGVRGIATSHIETLTAQEIGWHKREQRRRAAEHFERDLREMPAAELRQLAKAQEEEGSRERWQAAIERLLEVDRTPTSLNQAGAALRKLGQTDRAEALLRESINIDGAGATNSAAYTSLMALLRGGRRRKRLEEARQIGFCLLAETHRDPYVLNALAGVCSDLGERGKAEGLLLEAARAGPTRNPAIRELARLRDDYARDGNDDAAKRIGRALTLLASA